MQSSKWIWMPHAGHFICGNDCRFHLSTYVGKYVVSTVGELWSCRSTREIHAGVYDPVWLANNKHLHGDEFDHAYMIKFGFEEIGCNRKYETKVFKAKKSPEKKSCCPYRIIVEGELDFEGYNKPEDARIGHLKMCKKWGTK
jgi:hypothetical protein